MYSLPVVIAGCNENVLPLVRRELLIREAEVEAEFRGINEFLLQAHDFRGDPRLFVHLQNEQHVRDLRCLSANQVGRPILAIVEKGSCRDDVIAAMRAGASQVVVLPLDPADFQSALDTIGTQRIQTATAARLIAVSGVTGGCGATTLAVNLAYELAHSAQRQVVLAELSMQMGMLVTYLEFEAKYTIEDLIRYGSELDAHVVEQALAKVSEWLRVLAGPEHPIAISEDLPVRLRLILNYLRNLADVVVMDEPCTFDEAYVDLLASADEVVFVGEQRIPAIRNVQLVLQSLAQKGSRGRAHLVLNRYDPQLEGFTATTCSKRTYRACKRWRTIPCW